MSSCWWGTGRGEGTTGGDTQCSWDDEWGVFQVYDWVDSQYWSRSRILGLSHPLQLWPGLHRRDQTETGDETEGTPRCLPEGDDGEVSCSRACMGESPPYPLGGDHSSGPWQRTGDETEGTPRCLWHPQRNASTKMENRKLDSCDEEAGREEKSSLTFDLQGCVSSVVQSKRQQAIFQTQVGNR